MSNIKFKDFIKGFTEYLDEFEIAEELGVSSETITLWKDGIEPPPAILKSIKDFFKGAIEELESSQNTLKCDKDFENPIAKRLHQKLLHDSTLEVLERYQN
jgi:hypothetical protein